MQLKIILTLIALLTMQSLTAVQAGVPSFTSVGPAADPNCDFNTIQEGILATSEAVHIVAGVYEENISINNSDETLVGGFADCNAAELGIREPGTMATVAPASSVAFIATVGKGQERDVTITGLNFTQGEASGFAPAGGLVVAGLINVALFESRIANNTGVLGGGAYVGPNASLFLRDTRVEHNVASAGGGIYCSGCDLSIDRGSSLYQNQAIGNESDTIDADGGGLHMSNGAQVLVFAGSTTPEQDNLGIHENSAYRYGGGVYLSESELFMHGHDFFGFGDIENPASVTHNVAQHSGGGIYGEFNAEVTLTAIDLRDNTAPDYGGGISLWFNSILTINAQDLFDVDDCWHQNPQKCNRIMGNGISNPGEGSGFGGAIFVNTSELNIINTWFEGNYAGGNGSGRGAVAFIESSDAIIQNSVMYQNGIETGQDRNLLDFWFSETHLRFNTIVDNNALTDAVIRLYDDDGEDFVINSSIIHESSGVPVLYLQGDDEEGDFNFNCMLVHEDASFTGLGSTVGVTVGDPMFFDRAAGDFNLFSGSELALDQCGGGGSVPPDYDLNLNTRGLDFSQVGNDFIGYFDIGAIEYQGSDMNLDVIFANGFD